MSSYELPHTRLPVTLCQMASFRANGDLFDGRGVAPDVLVEPKPEDVLVSGRDSVLEAALAGLKSQAPSRPPAKQEQRPQSQAGHPE